MQYSELKNRSSETQNHTPPDRKNKLVKITLNQRGKANQWNTKSHSELTKNIGEASNHTPDRKKTTQCAKLHSGLTKQHTDKT